MLRPAKLSEPTVCKAVRVGGTVGPRQKASWLGLRPQACQAFIGPLELSLSTKCAIFMNADDKSHKGLLLHCNSIGKSMALKHERYWKCHSSCVKWCSEFLWNGPLTSLHSPIAVISNLKSHSSFLLTTNGFQSVWTFNFPFNFLLAVVTRKQLLLADLQWSRKLTWKKYRKPLWP